jgi:hypothetical protein
LAFLRIGANDVRISAAFGLSSAFVQYASYKRHLLVRLSKIVNTNQQHNFGNKIEDTMQTILLISVSPVCPASIRALSSKKKQQSFPSFPIAVTLGPQS